MSEEGNEVMFCDICKANQATIHRMVARNKGSTGSGKIIHLKHFCLECFEIVTQKIGKSPPYKLPISANRLRDVSSERTS